MFSLCAYQRLSGLVFLEYVFITMSSTPRFLFLNMHTRKFVTWHTFKTTFLSAKILMELPYRLKLRAKYIYYYGLTLLENKVHAGLGNDIIDFQINTRNNPDLAYLGKNQDGFYPYAYEETHLMMSQEWEEELLFASRNAYQNNPEKREQLATECRRYITKNHAPEKILDRYEEVIEELLRQT